jgi:hypothetical protein
MRHRRTRLGLLLLTMAVGSANACSNQGEGQRCDKLSGNDDCESGLICTTLTPATTTVATDGGGVKAPATYTPSVCCPDPMTRIPATTAACQSVGSGATSGSESGGSESGGSGGGESGGSAGTDGGADASVEAGP